MIPFLLLFLTETAYVLHKNFYATMYFPLTSHYLNNNYNLYQIADESPRYQFHSPPNIHVNLTKIPQN
jgi:hypothetical protein